MKKCKKCGKNLKIEFFYKLNKKYTINTCKLCYKKYYGHPYYIKNKKRINERLEKWRKENPEIRRAYWRKLRQTLKGKYTTYKYNAKKGKRNFEISFIEFKNIISKSCHYCGSISKIGIDRKDNDLGYTNKNSLPCCWKCNQFKKTRNYKEFINHCKSISKHLCQK